MATTRKIVPVTTDLGADGDKLCAALAEKFTNPATGAPYFTFKVEGGHVVAEGDAWDQKASVRPAQASVILFAEGYVRCLRDR